MATKRLYRVLSEHSGPERAPLYMEAGHNYRIYMSLSSRDNLRAYAESRLNHLATE